MPKSKEDFVDFSQVKKSVSIVQILEHYGLTSKLRQSGDKFSGSCPIHNGDNPTHFRVSISKNCWNCFGKCQRGGNILDFVSLKEEVSIRQAALLIQEWFGIASRRANRPDDKPQSSATKPKPQPKAGIDCSDSDNRTENAPLTFSLEHLDKAHPYLAERGLNEATIEAFGLGFCKKGLLTGRIAIPIHNTSGALVAYAGRWVGNPPEETPKYKLPAGFKKSLELFNLHRTIQESPDEPLVLVEGLFDCIKLWQHGLKRVVALMGNALSPAQEELIRKHTTSRSQVLLMLDEDDAGRSAREEIVKRLAKFAFVKIHVFDEEGKQPENLSADEVAAVIGGVQ